MVMGTGASAFVIQGAKLEECHSGDVKLGGGRWELVWRVVVVVVKGWGCCGSDGVVVPVSVDCGCGAVVSGFLVKLPINGGL